MLVSGPQHWQRNRRVGIIRGPIQKWHQKAIYALSLASLCLLNAMNVAAQAAPEQKPPTAEDVFKNVQVLRGISVDEFIGTMGFFAASLGMNCADCHTAESADNWAKFADDTPRKQTARKMVLMVRALNQSNFGGKPTITCYSCHRGVFDRPENIPSLAEQYGTPPPDDPDRIQIRGKGAAGPSADQILDRYTDALGGAQQLAKLISFTAKGTYAGFDTGAEVPIEIFATTPDQLTSIVHTPLGDITTVCDGRAAWVAAFDKPVPLYALTGGQLDGARIDAKLSFPAQIKQAFGNWRSGFPELTIDDHAVQVIEGTTSSGGTVKLYFDKQSGLLVRQVRYSATLVGTNPTHIDYSDYRSVAGVKIPFHRVVTWTDGQSTIQLTGVQPNAAIEASRFAKPAPAPPPKIAAQ
jgi:photosynthetic reaction center cytochrome c subunit